MKLYNRYIICVLFLISAFLGCDPISSYKVYVKNNSSNDLKILLYDKTPSSSEKKPFDSVSVEKGSTKLLKSSSERASVELCTNKKDSIVAIVRDNPSLSVLKNLNTEDSYQSSKSGNSTKGYSIRCEVIITDADIVLK